MERLAKSFCAGLFLAAAGVLLGGCAGAYLHDSAKADSGASASTAYTEAAPLTVLDDARTNLTQLKEAELAAVRENRRLVFDLELMSLAADEVRPLADLMVDTRNRVSRLGFPDIAAARAHLVGSSQAVVTNQSLTDAAARARTWGGPAFPPCRRDGELPATLPGDWAEGLAPPNVGIVQREYDLYRTRCQELRASASAPAGDLRQAERAWQAAQQHVADVRAAIAAGRRAVGQAAADTAEARTAEPAPDVAGTARAVAEVGESGLAQGIEAISSIGLDHPAFAQIDAIQALLRAVAEGKVARANQDASQLATAAEIAARAPGLAQEMADLRAHGTAPSVTNLLIALNHLKLRVARDETRLLIAQQRVALRRRQYEAALSELRARIQVFDQLCTYAEVSAGRPHPGAGCDAFEVAVAPAQRRAPAVSCTGVDGAALSNCALGRTFRQSLSARQPTAATRALYRVVRALALAHDSRTRAIETDYRLVDLRHRDALASNRLAIASYNNLVAVPVQRIADYHAGGIRPAEIGALLVQGLGFTAVTTGILVDD